MSKIDDTLVLLKGLSSTEVETLQNEGKINAIDTSSTRTIKKIVFSNTFTFFNLIFLFITIWLISVGSYNNLISMSIVLLNLIIGITQEIRAKNIVDGLTLLNSPTTFVVRDNKEIEISSQEIVLGDVIVLSAGDQVPADCLILRGNIEVNESMLTGESDLIKKRKDYHLYGGSFIVSGTCRAKTTAIGNDTYIQKLTKEAKQFSKPNSQILNGLNWLILIISIIVVPLGIALFFNNLITMGHEWEGIKSILDQEVAVKTAAGVMGMIPAGLYLMTSVSLAVGSQKLAKNNTLVQNLYCIEMLARVDVLCLDKTGTITDGSMSVDNFFSINPHEDDNNRKIISSILHHLNDSNMTSLALMDYFEKKEYHKANNILGFSSQRKYSAVQLENTGLFLLGAPEFVLPEMSRSTKITLSKFTKQGNRVLAIAKSSGQFTEDGVVGGQNNIVGYIVISDNIRPEAPDTLKFFRDNGVEIKVISGDNVETVSEIAKLTGIKNADKYISLETLSDEEVFEAATEYTIFGRVKPEQKQILVRALKSHGKQVGMTGDGVNDILALKEADCSIAMAEGSDAAKSVAHLVLMDSNFANMPKVVKEGRRVINNIQKGASLFLMKTVYSIMIVLLVLVLNEEYPFIPIQQMLIEAFVIGLPAFLLALEGNFEVVQGGFISSALKRAIPSSIVISLQVLILFLFSRIPEFSEFLDPNTISTISILTTLIVGLTLLHDLCKPFNFYRVSVYAAMIFTCLFSLVYLGDFFQIPTSLITDYPLVMLIFSFLVLFGLYIMKVIKVTPSIVKNIVNEVSDLVDYIQIRERRNREIQEKLLSKTNSTENKKETD